MTDPVTFTLAVLALLATPGPTNTLLAASGAAIGFRRSLKSVPAEIAGYVMSITLLVGVAGPRVAAVPELGAALRLAAGFYLAYAALKLWRGTADKLAAVPSPASPSRVFVTTLLNPKGLVFAFAIFPAVPLTALGPSFALFTVSVVLVGSAWIAFGAFLARSVGRIVTPALVSRVAAVVVALFATVLTGAALAAVL